MSLSELRRGQWAVVGDIPDEELRVQLLRFGVTRGSRVRCHSRVPLGPVVVQYAGQEIALGRQAACGVRVHCGQCEGRGRRRRWQGRR